MRATLRRLYPYLLPYRWRYGGGFAALLLRGLLATALPYLLGRAIDALAERDHEAAYQWAGLLLLVAASKGVAQYGMRWILITLSRDIEYDLRNDLTEHLLGLDRTFYERYRTGDLMARATNDLAQVRSLLGPGLMYSAEIAVIFVPVLTVMAVTDWVLTLLVFAPMPFISLGVSHFGRRTHEQFQKVQQSYSAVSARVQEHLQGLRMLRAYNQGRWEERRFEAANAGYVDESLGLVRIWRAFYPLLEFLVGVAGISVLGFGSWRVLQGEISLGTFTMFLYFLAMLTWPMIGMGVVVNITQRGVASMGRLNILLETEPVVADAAASLRPGRPASGAVAWQGVTVRYPGSNRPALDDVTLRIPDGRSLAVIGPVGSGKSTLANLLPRLIEPDSGAVLLGGVDVRRLPLSVLRRAVGHVPQETFLFSRRISQNVALGDPGASAERIRSAARAAMLDTAQDSFPDGLETMVGERGITLSGGQKQRVAIARALLIDPAVVVLDDATASVDMETEHELLARLRRGTRSKTLLIVTHRVATARLADSIAVLDQGRVVAAGDHEELLASRGLYARLHDRQRIEEELLAL